MARTDVSWIGVDPGGAATGVVVVAPDGGLVDWVVLDRADYASDGLYAAGLRSVLRTWRSPQQRVAVEDVVHPNPHMGLANMKGLIDTAKMLGVVLAFHPDAYVIRPGGHGSGPRRMYPPELWGARERKGTGKLRHCRSAWDVVQAAIASERVTRLQRP